MSDPVADALQVIDDDEPFAREKRESIAGAAATMRRQLEGFVTRIYDMGTGHSEWAFGTFRWKRLIDPVTNERWADDPLGPDTGELPLATFLEYLRDWYHPRRQCADSATGESA